MGPGGRVMTWNIHHGTGYLLCFDLPFGHARHYLGITDNLPQRLWGHAHGKGAKLTGYASKAGGTRRWNKAPQAAQAEFRADREQAAQAWGLAPHPEVRAESRVLVELACGKPVTTPALHRHAPAAPPAAADLTSPRADVPAPQESADPDDPRAWPSAQWAPAELIPQPGARSAEAAGADDPWAQDPWACGGLDREAG